MDSYSNGLLEVLRSIHVFKDRENIIHLFDLRSTLEIQYICSANLKYFIYMFFQKLIVIND